MSQFTNNKSFNFEEWLKENELSEYKQIFIDMNMMDLQSLDVNNPSFPKLVTDQRLNGKQQTVQMIIRSIQLLHPPESVPFISRKEVSKTTPSSTDFNMDLINKLIKEQHDELNKLKIALKHNKEKYSKYFFKRNEEKLLNYIDNLPITKSSIISSFKSLSDALKKEETRIMKEVSIQQTNASLIQSNINNNKKFGCPIQKCLALNDELIINHIKFLDHIAINTDNISSSEEMITFSDKIRKEFMKTVENFNKNSDDIDKNMNECDYCKLSIPLINEMVYNEIRADIDKLTRFELCCPINIKITDINFINDTMIRIEFKINPQREFKECEVLYTYNSNINNIINQEESEYDDAEDDIKSEEDIEWFITTNIKSIKYKDNNKNSMIVKIDKLEKIDNNNINNINIKIRFHRICDNSWSRFSNIYNIINRTSSPEPEKIKNIFYLSQDLKRNPKGLYIANNTTNTSTSCNVFELNEPHHLTTRQTGKWLIKYAGICYAKNILLPHIINISISKIYQSQKQTHKRFNCLFKCGGTIGDTLASKYCSAVIFDDFNRFNDSFFEDRDKNKDKATSDDIKSVTTPSSTRSSDISTADKFAINWELPLLPEQTDCNDITYSTHYGLLSCGGWEFRYNSNKFYRLSFNSEQYFNQNVGNYWKWDIMPSMQSKRSWPTLVMLDDEYRLMVIGGKGPLNTVEMFNFNDNKWIYLNNINHARSSCGVYYDKLITNNIYLGGGHGALQNVEYYNINKDKWFCDLPNTKTGHGSRPVLWIGDDGHLLYIASVYSDSMEYIDLRMNNKYWNIIYGTNYNQLWHNVFGTEFAKSRNCRLCLS